MGIKVAVGSETMDQRLDARPASPDFGLQPTLAIIIQSKF
jgi:hypothetical protein